MSERVIWVLSLQLKIGIVKDFDKIDLKNASILDLTDDLELMRKALDLDDFEPSDVERWGAEGKMHSLYEFGLFTNNDALLDKLEIIFEHELDAIYNE